MKNHIKMHLHSLCVITKTVILQLNQLHPQYVGPVHLNVFDVAIKTFASGSAKRDISILPTRNVIWMLGWRERLAPVMFFGEKS